MKVKRKEKGRRTLGKNSVKYGVGSNLGYEHSLSSASKIKQNHCLRL
jgi:hypothetical protein